MPDELPPADPLPLRLQWFAPWRWNPWARAALIALAILAALAVVFSIVRDARDYL